MRYNGIYHPSGDEVAELSNSSQVKEIQEFLLSKGYDLGNWGADGDLGPVTKTAIYNYFKTKKEEKGAGVQNPRSPRLKPSTPMQALP